MFSHLEEVTYSRLHIGIMIQGLAIEQDVLIPEFGMNGIIWIRKGGRSEPPFIYTFIVVAITVYAHFIVVVIASLLYVLVLSMVILSLETITVTFHELKAAIAYIPEPIGFIIMKPPPSPSRFDVPVSNVPDVHFRKLTPSSYCYWWLTNKE